MKHRDDLLTTKEAAMYVHRSHRTLERYRVTGEGPPYLKMGRPVLYRIRDLDRWLDGCVRRSTSDPGPGEPRPRPKRDRGSKVDFDSKSDSASTRQ